ncbi:MAG: phosphoglucosamine mutase [Nitriliruptorales bacterium]|nr:phosphoglucosamine mutase [Nitriliruptorales bacterium]
MGQLFGTDGVRGVANSELTPELAVGLGRALIRTVRERGVERPLIAIGRDPRASGEMLESSLVAGVCSAGGDAIILGVLPTPGVAYLTQFADADSGAVISASHNPVEDNGIKFFGPDGYKLSDAEEARVEELLQRSDDDRPVGREIGRRRLRGDLVDRYVQHLVGVGRLAVAGASAEPFAGLHVALDCANGAAAAVSPAVLEQLGCRVTALHASPDGNNINDGCGSTHPEVVAAAVVGAGANLGLAHDGDADRLIAVDHTGAIVDGDAILAVLAARLHARHGLRSVVTTVMTNLGFKRAMEGLGIGVVQTRVGDRYVLEAMRAGGHPLGGEQSGHLIFAEHATTGDGVLTAVQLLAALVAEQRPLADLAKVMRRLPQVLLNVPRVDRGRLARADRIWKMVANEEERLGDAGRILVRASGTEPLVRIMVEAESEPTATATAERIAAVVADELALTP